jgi:hypothetical protein
MAEIDDRIAGLDTGYFSRISTQTTDADRTSLLLLQDCMRRRGPYVYLEIGSHLGGTIQSFYADPSCHRIFSIDLRPATQPDQRGQPCAYPENSTARMLDNLREAYPGIGPDKVTTFDSDASAVDRKRIEPRPDLCFIDGEHTTRAVLSDFDFCANVIGEHGVVLFHDAFIIQEGIRRIRKSLAQKGAKAHGMMLAGDVYAIFLGESHARFGDRVHRLERDDVAYFRRGRLWLLREQLRSRAPLLFRLVMAIRERTRH